MVEKLDRLKLGFTTTKLYSAAEQAEVADFRRAGLGLLMNVDGPAKPLAFVEDTAVSPEKLPAYVARLTKSLRATVQKPVTTVTQVSAVSTYVH